MTVACRVVNVKTEEPDVYIGRPSRWGNPFPMKHESERADVIERYRRWLHEQILAGRITLDELRALDGKTLGCYCAPKACHGDVLARAVAWALTQPHTAADTPSPSVA